MTIDKSLYTVMEVAGLVLDPATNAPIVVLKSTTSTDCLPIWIGVAEATSIAAALKNISPARPMTHDLMNDTIKQLGSEISSVCVTDLVENTFLAKIELITKTQTNLIEARPSDAIALAVRVGCPIYVSSKVLDQAKVSILAFETGEADVTDLQQNPEGRNFANINKEQWEEMLEDMDPDDFKYKM